MKYTTILAKTRHLSAFKFQDLEPRRALLPHEKVQILRWAKEGRFIRLRHGLYALNDEERKAPISALWLSSRIYWPSYVSLEYALSFYGIVPEAVGSVTCVTTLKTKTFKSPYGVFVYHKTRPEYFFGYHTQKTQDGGQSFWMADPEKAVLDFIYLSIPKKLKLSADLFLESYRFQNLDTLKAAKLKDYGNRFKNPRARGGASVLLKLIKK